MSQPQELSKAWNKFILELSKCYKAWKKYQELYESEDWKKYPPDAQYWFSQFSGQIPFRYIVDTLVNQTDGAFHGFLITIPKKEANNGS